MKDITHLGVDELDTKGVGQEKDSLVLGVIDGRRCDVGLHTVDDFDFACGEKGVGLGAVSVRFRSYTYPLGCPRDERLSLYDRVSSISDSWIDEHA